MFRKSLLFIALLFTFLSVSVHFLYATTTASFTTDYAPNNEDNIVAGDDVTFTNTSVTDGTVESITWSLDGVHIGSGSPIVFDFPTAGPHTVTMWIKVDNEDFQIPVSRQFNVRSWAVYLKSVGFESADGVWHEVYRDIEQTKYSAKPNEPYGDNPQWFDNSEPLNGSAEEEDDGDKKYPVCYTSGSQMQVQVILIGKGPVPQPMWIYGQNPDGFSFQLNGGAGVRVNWDVATLVGCNVLNCDKDFDTDKVKFWENFDIEWNVKCGTGPFKPIGHSQNDMHVTWHDPITGAHSTYLYHTLIYHACNGADNQVSESSIVDGIWSVFSRKVVFRRQDNAWLQFHHNYNLQNETTSALLGSDDADGLSEAWADFMLDCMKVHGIFSTSNTYIILPYHNDSDKFALNNWEVYGVTVSLITGYPYTNIFENNDVTNRHDWVYDNYEDEQGVAGQGCINPASWFEEFYLVYYESKFYDPSHGIRYDSMASFENTAIASYSKTVNVDVSERDVLCDLNGDGDAVDTDLHGDVTGFIENPTGDQTTYSVTTK